MILLSPTAFASPLPTPPWQWRHLPPDAPPPDEDPPPGHDRPQDDGPVHPEPDTCRGPAR